MLPEPLIETESERLLTVEVLIEADSLACLLLLAKSLMDFEALSEALLIDIEALSLLAEVLAEAWVLSLATELLIDFIAESEELSIAD
ncbi:hypothetical protein M3M35_06955 [Fructilactobacillus myrtifloralis]|uniref:Uncharacterized protein n=1 Tax=Fructilactobacillus myrtifloralis TaxID=2940301 RepID=A0ABY5BPL2_9LACO|nr:hypothetical protein [Fructilactobacillus myrtifloralis]USS85011.1 hypothetical protein M3M35_06905 [Fructilactobacillus myrtifloralis]USS85013.1 hypothetical protein M3M35_06915 [Fructilactobacillus myrtifloralis]USS85017.1 hypothetical protein M3M35_06935 [Fructilactobacillus myrtifloralis]USS85021.1 hypothetical protein M3M35_06955 [Fructilactobacillus myrtifloralis]